MVSHDKPPRDRVTLLPAVLLASRASVYLLDGADKQVALTAVLAGELQPVKYPSQLIARADKQVDWFLAGLTWPT